MNPASPSPPLSFPDWPAALSRLPLKELERGAYRAALTSYLRFCKQTRQRATVGSARQFMVQVQERRRLGVSQLNTWKAALNWFFKAGANQRVRAQPVQHRTSNIEHRTSNIEHRTSNIEQRPKMGRGKDEFLDGVGGNGLLSTGSKPERCSEESLQFAKSKGAFESGPAHLSNHGEAG